MSNPHKKAFTVLELLTALAVGTIILAAAATMASAVSNGKSALERSYADIAYVAALQARIAEAVHRAETIDPIADGARLSYASGQTISIYKDNLNQLWINDSVNGTAMFKHQKAVSVERKSPKRIEIIIVREQNGMDVPYRFTASRYAGP